MIRRPDDRRCKEVCSALWEPLRLPWAVNDAIKRGELTTDTEVDALVEMLVAVMWGMGFYGGFVGDHDELKAVVQQFELLMGNNLWRLQS